MLLKYSLADHQLTYKLNCCEMFKTRLSLKIIILLTTALRASLASAQIHLNAHDKSIRYDLVKPEHSLRKVTSFDTAGNVTRELVVDHVTRIDTARNEIDFIN